MRRADPLDVLGGFRLDSPAEVFHENSKVRRLGAAGGISGEVLHAMAHGFKAYGSAERTELPAPRESSPMTVQQAIRRRVSTREYTTEPLSAQDLSTVLFSAYGVLPERGRRRTVPSGGGLYPLEVYLAVLRGGEIPVGVYHYDVRGHALERLPGTTDPERLRTVVFVPEAGASAAAFLVVTAVFGRSRIKYGERAYRFALMESGHVMENVALECAASGIGCCPFGGFVDDEVDDVLGIDGVDESALYLATLGVLPGR